MLYGGDSKSGHLERLYTHDGLLWVLHYGLNPIPNVKECGTYTRFFCIRTGHKLAESSNVKFYSKQEFLGENACSLRVNYSSACFEHGGLLYYPKHSDIARGEKDLRLRNPEVAFGCSSACILCH